MSIETEVDIVLVIRALYMSTRIMSCSVYLVPIAKRAIFLFEQTYKRNITGGETVAKSQGVLSNYAQERNAWGITRYSIQLRL